MLLEKRATYAAVRGAASKGAVTDGASIGEPPAKRKWQAPLPAFTDRG
jgi:hypothetical protein